MSVFDSVLFSKNINVQQQKQTMSIQQQTINRIGLFGFGTVGESLYHVLQKTPSLRTQIVKVAILHPEKKRNAPPDLFTTNASEILEDGSIGTIIELIDDADA